MALLSDPDSLGDNALGKFTTTFNLAVAFAGAGDFETISGIGFMIADADTSPGSWTNELNAASPLFPSVDEAIINDLDYIKSSATPINDAVKLNLSDPIGGAASPFSVLYRYRKSGSLQIDLVVSLMEGVSTIASWTHTDIPDSYVQVEQTLTAPQFASISDPNNLSIQFSANKP